ncbi:MAG: ATP-binding protein [bacterium]|nr:ATP-binding protein [bacterium]
MQSTTGGGGIIGRLKWLMFVRLMLVSLLLGMSPFIHARGSTPFFAVLAFLYGASLVYTLLLKTPLAPRFQAYTQFVIDAAVITALLAFTGGVDSEFVLLYVLCIVYASAFISGRGGIVLAVVCSALYAALGVMECLRLLPRGPGTGAPLAGDPIYVGYLVLARATIFCIVGYLLDYLVDTISRERIELDYLKKLNEQVVAGMDVGLLTADVHGKVIFASPAAEAILGTARRDIVGRSWQAFLGRPVGEISDRWLAEEARSFTRCEVAVRRGDGAEVPVGFTMSNLLDGDGRALGLLILFKDLTPIRRLEERMRRTDRLTAVGAILSSVAHEVRTPLSAVRGAVEILREEGIDAETRSKMTEIALKESDRLNRIIGDFLNYGRARGEERVLVDLGVLVREAIDLIRGRRGGDGVTIAAPPEGPPICASLDAARVKQVFINILDNAVDASKGKGSVTVSLERGAAEDGGGPVARVRILDTGEGMSAERLSRLFEPFYSTREGGTGMGVFLAEGIVRDHGGGIEAESRVGEGTTVVVTLPCEPEGEGAVDGERPHR